MKEDVKAILITQRIESWLKQTYRSIELQKISKTKLVL